MNNYQINKARASFAAALSSSMSNGGCTQDFITDTVVIFRDGQRVSLQRAEIGAALEAAVNVALDTDEKPLPPEKRVDVTEYRRVFDHDFQAKAPENTAVRAQILLLCEMLELMRKMADAATLMSHPAMVVDQAFYPRATVDRSGTPHTDAAKAARHPYGTLKASVYNKPAAEAVDSLLRFIAQLGFVTCDGDPDVGSGFGVLYRRWINGEGPEGFAPHPVADVDQLVTQAMAMFRLAWDQGERVVVWRIKPKIESDFKTGGHRLYFRWHFLKEFPVIEPAAPPAPRCGKNIGIGDTTCTLTRGHAGECDDDNPF